VHSGPAAAPDRASAAWGAAAAAAACSGGGAPLLRTTHRLYLSEQTEQAKLDPPKLIAVDCEVARPCVASAGSLSAWNEYGRAACVRVVKTLVHPGEVNKIRELPSHPHVVVTHTDSPELYVWNMETQPDVRPRAPAPQGAGPGGSNGGGPTGGGLTASGAGVAWPTAPSVADAVLRGHKQDAQFPLATSAAGASGGGPSLVASGGQDRLVLLWSLADIASSALAGGGGAGGGSAGGAGGGAGGGGGVGGAPSTRGGGAGRGPTPIEARVRLEGHGDTVEDVVFRPGSSDVLASVGDDKRALFWDCRAGRSPVCCVSDAHGPSADVHCVDWSGLRDHLVATGAADGSVRVWDVRALSSALSGPAAAGAGARGGAGGGAGGLAAASGAAAPACVRTWKGAHTSAVMRIEWHPHAPGVFASGGEDHTVLIWRWDGAGGGGGGAEGEAAAAAAEAEGGGGAGGGRGGRAAAPAGTGGGAAPKELLFRHVGHRQGRVIDFQWCPNDEWLLASVSDDTSADTPAAAAAATAAAAAAATATAAAAAAAAAATGATPEPGAAVDAPAVPAAAAVLPRGGGTLQVWRVNDLLYRPDDEVVAELERHREWMVGGSRPPTSLSAAPVAAGGPGSGAAAAAAGAGAGADGAATAAAAPAAAAAAPAGTPVA